MTSNAGRFDPENGHADFDASTLDGQVVSGMFIASMNAYGQQGKCVFGGWAILGS